MEKILVINPNSSVHVTEGIAASVASVDQEDRAFLFTQLDEAPAGIESDADIAMVIPMLKNTIEPSDADAFIIACFSDPGIAQLRQSTGKNIFGIGECAYLAASAHGKFGVISILEESVQRHRQYIQQLGLAGHLASDEALNLGVLELKNEEASLARAKIVGQSLVSQGADCVILGCAGMGYLQTTLEQHLQVPIIEPCQAAAIRGGQSGTKK